MLTQFVELLVPKEAKLQEASEAEKPNEASAKKKLNFKQNKLDNVADTICREADTTSIGDVRSCKTKEG